MNEESSIEVMYRFLKFSIEELEFQLAELENLSTTEEDKLDYQNKLTALNKLKKQIKEYEKSK